MGLCVAIAVWAAVGVAFVVATTKPTTRRPAVPPVVAARAKSDYEALRNGHAH